jgi:hypothetical protein
MHADVWWAGARELDGGAASLLQAAPSFDWHSPGYFLGSGRSAP